MEEPKEYSKAIVKNSIYGVSTWLLPLSLSFVATPLIVKGLGNDDYGIYALVLGFIAYSFNFNVGRAITKYLAEFRVTGENERISEVISATLFINLMLGGVGLFIIFLTANLLVENVFNIPAEAQAKTIYAFYAAGMTIFFLMLNQVFSSILQGLHRFDVYAKIVILNNVLLTSGNLVLAVKGFGLLSLLIWNLFITAVSAIFAAIAARQLLPELPLKINFRKETLKLVFKYSSSVIVYQILANLLLLFERSWITSRLGTESLTFYVVPMMLGLYIHSFVSSLMLAIFPLVSELKDEKEKLFRLYKRATKIAGFLAVLIGTTLVVESKVFLALWMGTDFAAKSTPILIVHTISFSLLAIVIVAWQLTEGLGYPNYNRNFFIVCFVISIFGIISLTPALGSYGVGIGRLLGSAVLFASIFYAEKRFFDKIQVKLWLQIIGILIVSAALMGLAENLITGKFGINWFSLILAGLSGTIIYCSTAWLLGFFGEDDIALLKKLVKR